MSYLISISFFLIMFIIWALFIVNYYRKMIYRDLKFTETIDPNLKEEYKCFERYDRKNWNLMEIYIGGIFLMPLRFICLFFVTGYLSLVFKVLGMTKKDSYKYEYPKWKTEIARINANFVCVLL
jgi:hypothetical protein